VIALIVLTSFSTFWSDTRFPTAANAGALGLLLVTCFSFVARYAPSARTTTETVERAAGLVILLVVVGLVPRLHPDEMSIAGRLRGFFSNANGLGISCALIAPWVAVRVTRTTRGQRFLGIVALVALTGLAFFSGSRTGLGGLIVGTATTLFLRRPSRFLLVAVLGGIGLSIATLAGGRDIDLDEGAVGNLARTQTVGRLSGRLARWEEGIERFAEAPLLGHGFKSSWGYEATDSREAGEAISLTAAGTNYHSQHIETLVDLGIVGEAILLLVLGGAWHRARWLARRRDDDALAGAGAAFAGTFVAAALDSFFHNWLFTAGSPYAFFFWSLFAMCLSLHRLAQAPASLPAVVPSPPAGVLA
jgi:O-antigen ligase